MLTANEIVKEQMLQTTSKKVLRSSKKQKLRTYVPHTPYVRTRGFIPATAYLNSFEIGKFKFLTIPFTHMTVNYLGKFHGV